MKHLNLLLGAALAAFSFAACQPEENPADQPASITIDPEDNVEFPAKGAESHFVEVVSTRDWKIDNVPNWMAVSKDGQSVKDTKIEASLKAVTIEISVQDNDEYDRSANLTFNAGIKKKTITVTQKGEKAARDGSKNSPFTASQARTEALKLSSGTVSSQEYYIEGIIHKIATPKDTDFNEDGTLKYGNISFYISDDGTSSKDNDFYCYRTYNLDGANFSKLDELKVGDAVVVCGKITNYNGTPETNGADKPYLYSLNGKTGEGDAPAETLTIDQIIAKQTGNVKTTGKIMHVGKNGTILNDGTDKNLYVYTTTTTFKKGDVVDVEGKAKLYNGLVEIDSGATYAASSKTVNAKEIPARTLTVAEMESYSVAHSELVSFTGTLKKNGNYVNIVLDGTTSLQGSYNTAEDVSSFNGRRVTVTGYYGGKSVSSGTTYFNVIGTEIKGDGSDYFSVSTESISVSATDTKASFDITTNLAWTASSDNAGFSLDKTSGTGAATIEVTFAANTDENNAKTAKITVSTTLGTKTVTITQKAVQSAQTIILTFPDDNKANNGVSSYTETWTAITNGVSFSMVNFNNNKWGNDWTHIRCGRKGNDSVAEIKNDSPFSITVSKVVVTVDKVTSGNVKSTKLEVSPSKDFDKDVQSVPVTIKQGENEYAVPNPAANLYYKLVFDCTSASANGVIHISNVTYLAK